MYSKEEAAQIKQEFWTSYGKYMSPVLSSEGLKQNWINYNTGIKHLFFRTLAERKRIYVGIQILHKDASMRSLIFEQFTQLKNILEEFTNEKWIWEENVTDDFGNAYSHIYIKNTNYTLFRKEDWPEIISFFKPRIIALDEFWNTVKYSFDIFK